MKNQATMIPKNAVLTMTMMRMMSWPFLLSCIKMLCVPLQTNYWILLDSQSTVDVFSNQNLGCKMWTHTTLQCGQCYCYSERWPQGIWNCLVLAQGYCEHYLSTQVQKKHKVTYNSFMMTGFVVHKPDGTSHMFKHLMKGYSSLMLDVTPRTY